ncbi:Uma2 family endonuclease [bacterium]|nr:Uma2 family endonuclease [bacterium]MBU1614211.1 Uma2 family endonuclease [bacterium]
MALPARKEVERYTYGDYLNWPDEERWELINGEAYDMSPAPSRWHQQISIELVRQIANFLSGKKCKAYHAPFDVRLPVADEDDSETMTVVQPDIVVICDPAKLDDRGCRGAPDFVVEILSPFTASKDQTKKLALYERHGVKEYWIIHPTDNLLTVRLLEKDGRYGIPKIYEGMGSLEVATLPGLTIDLDAVFQKPTFTP